MAGDQTVGALKRRITALESRIQNLEAAFSEDRKKSHAARGDMDGATNAVGTMVGEIIVDRFMRTEDPLKSFEIYVAQLLEEIDGLPGISPEPMSESNAAISRAMHRQKLEHNLGFYAREIAHRVKTGFGGPLP